MDDFIREFLIKFPGAIIRWLFLRNKRKFNDILKDDAENYLISLLFIVIIIVTIVMVKHI